MRLITLVLLLGMAAAGRAQGCSQCAQTVGQAPARTQQAYRRAIGLMVVAGCGVFGGALVMARRFR